MEDIDNISWKVLDTYFEQNPYHLVAHHLDSYNLFFKSKLKKIMKDNNPFRFIEKTSKKESDEPPFECMMYMGGYEGDRYHFSKPLIYDDDQGEDVKYMYPNLARVRDMTYGINIYYDIVVDFVYHEAGEKKTNSITIEKVFLCKFPVMLHSNLCILNSLPQSARSALGECTQDNGGYFIVGGNEKVLVSQEKFADNMLYVKKHNEDSNYLFSAEIRSVSEDPSKPIRTTSVNLVAESPRFTNLNIVVNVPNIRIPVPLFILMRALGVTSDKSIIQHCILDMEANEHMIDLFIPSVHDAAGIFTQQSAIHYLKEFTKMGTVNGVMQILMDFFLPHIGEENFIDKAYFLGYMVNKLLRVYNNIEQPTDRDNFMFKRVELSGTLIYQLFRDYYILQKKSIEKKIDTEFYYNVKKNTAAFMGLIQDNHSEFFKSTILNKGIRDAFKGKWGATPETIKVGVIQEFNRLSGNSAHSHLRKFILPLDSTAKVTGPRHLHASQWGYIDPADTPDGGNCGLHKHMAITTKVTSGTSADPMILWLRKNTTLKLLGESGKDTIASFTKIFVNGRWVGVLDNPVETISLFKLYRRIGLLPAYNSISFSYNTNEIFIFTDEGRLTRPMFFIFNGNLSFSPKKTLKAITDKDFSWEETVTGFAKKSEMNFQLTDNKYYEMSYLYPDVAKKLNENEILNKEALEKQFTNDMSVVEYVDTSEESSLFISTTIKELKKNKYYTHLEIHPSVILGVMGNSIIFPEENPTARNTFSCGQAKQAVSLYHTNFDVRFDKAAVLLNYGQIPLLKSRYLKYINEEKMPCGVNTIVAIMSYTGYNVEDAILINKGSIERGLFRTTYFSTYSAREESSMMGAPSVKTRFADVLKEPELRNVKANYDYDQLNENGIIREGTPMNDKTAVIGRVTTSSEGETVVSDASVFPKKGQLGIVDKTYMTDGEEGTRLVKVRVREERMPAVGDKMASRAGQKGTIGLVIPEKDMPYTKDGTRPDLIINPHAIPSRMTIGQFMESVIGKTNLILGGFGDCTAFTAKGANIDTYGDILMKNGFQAHGNDVMYSGYSGEQMEANIFMGPTYYMRLKHMVKDKINYRADGPKTAMTRQAVQGRANDGGLRIGEMERDGIMAHGASAFLNDAFMNRADEYHLAICNNTGNIAIYNKRQNIMISPGADGPLNFQTTFDGTVTMDKVSKFGRSFSIVRVPYSFKLLLQELQAMNVDMKIITEDNIDHLISMNYSRNVNKLLKNDNLQGVFTQLQREINSQKNILKDPVDTKVMRDMPVPSVADGIIMNNSGEGQGEDVFPGTPEGTPGMGLDVARPTSPLYPPTSPLYSPTSPGYSPTDGSQGEQKEQKVYGFTQRPDSQPEEGEVVSNGPIPYSSQKLQDDLMSGPVENKDVPDISKYTLADTEGFIPQTEPGETQENVMIKNSNIQAQFDRLPTEDKMKLMKIVANADTREEKEKRIEEAKEADAELSVATESIQRTQQLLKDAEESGSGNNSNSSGNRETTLNILKVGEDADANKEDADKESGESSGGSKKISFSL